MSTREWGVGYDEGYQKGWNDAMDQKPAEANEPVADIEHHKAGDNLVWDNPGANSSPFYTTPPQRTFIGLAAEDRLTAKYMQDAPDGIDAVIDYIEAKLKELNT